MGVCNMKQLAWYSKVGLSGELDVGLCVCGGGGGGGDS